MSFATSEAFLEAKKLFETYDLRVADNNLTVEDAYTAKITAEQLKIRNDLLRASDFTQLPDTTADTAAWATYRQQLRDLPNDPDWPTSHTMPTAPTL